MTLLERHMMALNTPGAPHPDTPDALDLVKKNG
jgi:hypothetical protein